MPYLAQVKYCIYSKLVVVVKIQPLQVAIGRRSKFIIHGDDFDTNDGTCVRGYVHIMDLVDGHLLALKAILRDQGQGCKIYHFGSQKGNN